MNNSVIGLDIAKYIFHLFTLLADGKTLKKKLKRSELLAFFANYPASIIGIEACGSPAFEAPMSRIPRCYIRATNL